MEKWKNFKLDDKSMWPKTGLVKLDAAHSDDRGSIHPINFPMKNISLSPLKRVQFVLIIII